MIWILKKGLKTFNSLVGTKVATHSEPIGKKLGHSNIRCLAAAFSITERKNTNYLKKKKDKKGKKRNFVGIEPGASEPKSNALPWSYRFLNENKVHNSNR